MSIAETKIAVRLIKSSGERWDTLILVSYNCNFLPEKWWSGAEGGYFSAQCVKATLRFLVHEHRCALSLFFQIAAYRLQMNLNIAALMSFSFQVLEVACTHMLTCTHTHTHKHTPCIYFPKILISLSPIIVTCSEKSISVETETY